MTKRFSDLSHLVSAGRVGKGIPASRKVILASLLRKRATARQAGLTDLEEMLRSQILWSLPIESPDDETPPDA